MNKVTNSVLLGATFSIVATVPAHAYLDAGTASILLQAMIGGVAAGLFVMRGYIYKAKAWFGQVGRRGGGPTDRK